MAELQDAHGFVSSGAGAMLVSAGWLYAAGECAAELAGESLDFDLFRTAASLTSTARQHELAAWKLGAARVRRARRGAAPGVGQRRREASGRSSARRRSGGAEARGVEHARDEDEEGEWRG